MFTSQVIPKLFDRVLNMSLIFALRSESVLQRDSNPQTHLVLKGAVNCLTILTGLTKWSSLPLRTEWLCVQVPLQSLKFQISRLPRAKSSLTFRQSQREDSF